MSKVELKIFASYLASEMRSSQVPYNSSSDEQDKEDYTFGLGASASPQAFVVERWPW